MKVPFVNFGQIHTDHKFEENYAIESCLSNGRLILQKDVEDFEAKLAEFVGTRYAVGVANCTDALFMSLKLAGIKEGNEVITVGHTFHATVEAIYWNGAKPVLCDVGEDGLIDVTKIKYLINENTKAIIPVHLMGDVCNMDAIQDIAREHNLIIIEDAAQALGGEWNGKKAGSFGLAGCFSFYPAKILGAPGDAGAIVTNDENFANELRDMRQHYKYNPGKFGFNPGKFGFNSRMDNVWASVLNVRMKYLSDWLARRKYIAQIYNTGLGGVGDLILPTVREGRVYQDYIIRTSKRDELFYFLKSHNIETMKNDYHFPLELTKPYGTVELESKTLRIPCNPEMTEEQAQFVIEKIKEFYHE